MLSKNELESILEYQKLLMKAHVETRLYVEAHDNQTIIRTLEVVLEKRRTM